MARPQKTKIEIVSDGTHKGTKVTLNGAVIRVHGFRFDGNKFAGYKLLLDLAEPEEENRKIIAE